MFARRYRDPGAYASPTCRPIKTKRPPHASLGSRLEPLDWSCLPSSRPSPSLPCSHDLPEIWQRKSNRIWCHRCRRTLASLATWRTDQVLAPSIYIWWWIDHLIPKPSSHLSLRKDPRWDHNLLLFLPVFLPCMVFRPCSCFSWKLLP
jgi:hypothetical protein